MPRSSRAICSPAAFRSFPSDLSPWAADKTLSASKPLMNKDGLQSMRSSFRDRTTDQRGYVLISAIALAVLYFGLMELMMIDSSRALREAQRFRARIVASVLAENAAELAAANMITQPGSTTTAQDDQGKMIGAISVNGND